jgi:uncharacterized membrane protein YhhN
MNSETAHSKTRSALASPFALLAVPALVAIMALVTGLLPFKLGVPGLCALILAACFLRTASLPRREVWAVIAAFGMSMVGDYFLSNRKGHAQYFEAGIAGFFVAHLGYLSYALFNGRPHRLALAVLLVVFVPYFIFSLSPAIGSRVLWVAVLLYLLISCISLAAAVGIKQPALVKGFYVAGIGLVVLSDTFISFNEFLHYRALNGLILPTYYLAHLTITTSLLLRRAI